MIPHAKPLENTIIQFTPRTDQLTKILSFHLPFGLKWQQNYIRCQSNKRKASRGSCPKEGPEEFN